MTISATHLHDGSNGANDTSYVTGSFSIAADRVVLVTVAGAGNAVPSLSGHSLTWELVDATAGTLLYNGGSDRLAVFRAYAASASGPATITITWDASVNNCLWSIDEISGLRAGNNGGDGIRNVVSATGSSAAPSTTLAAFDDPDNGTFGAVAVRDDVTITEGAGFTDLATLTNGSPDMAILSQWRADNDTSVDASTAGVEDWGIIGLELRSGIVALAMTADAVSTVAGALTVLPPVDLAMTAHLTSVLAAGPMTVVYGAGSLTLVGASWREISSAIAPPILEIAYEEDSQAEPADWYDATDELRGFTLGRHRQATLGRWEALEGSITVDNRDRQHEPFYDGSPHFPWVRRRRQWRIRSPIGTPIARGYVRDMIPSYPSAVDAVVEWDVTDAMLPFATTPLLHPYEAAVRGRSPRAYYRLQGKPDALPAPIADVTGNQHHGTYAAAPGTLEYADSLVNDDKGVSVGLPPKGALLTFPASTMPAAPWSVEMLISQQLALDFDLFTLESSAGPIIRVSVDPFLSVSLNPDESVISTLIRPNAVNQILISCGLTNIALYVNGAFVADRTAPATALTAGLMLKVGNQRASVQPGWLAEATTEQSWFRVGEIAVYGEESDLTAVQSTHDAIAALEGQYPGERMGYILDQIGHAASLRDIQTGQVAMGPARTMGGLRALSALRAAADTEAGEFFVDRSGRPVLHDHFGPWRTRPRSIYVQHRFGPGADDLGYGAVSFAETDEFGANKIVVDWEFGDGAIEEDAAGIAADGTIDHAVESAARYAAQVEGHAEWLAWALQRPNSLRIAELTVTMRSSDQERLLEIQEMDRVQVTWQPPGGGDAIVNEGLVAGVHHDFGRADHRDGGRWTLTLSFIPIPPDDLDAWEWGVGAWDSTTTWTWGKGAV